MTYAANHKFNIPFENFVAFYSALLRISQEILSDTAQ